MSKKVEFIKNREEAAERIFRQSLERTPEERIQWLYRQIEIMNELSPNIQEPKGYVLKKSDG